MTWRQTQFKKPQQKNSVDAWAFDFGEFKEAASVQGLTSSNDRYRVMTWLRWKDAEVSDHETIDAAKAAAETRVRLWFEQAVAALRGQKEKHPAMDESSQRFMAFHGVMQWARAVILQRDRIEAGRKRQDEIGKERHELALDRQKGGPIGDNISRNRELGDELHRIMETFRADRHLFLIAAGQLVAHRKWIKDLGTVPDDVFAGVDAKAETIIDLRNTNEHVVDYFLGKGHAMKSWWHTSDGGSADASATVDDKIGGRLSWIEVADIADKLLKDIAPLERAATERPASSPRP